MATRDELMSCAHGYHEFGGPDGEELTECLHCGWSPEEPEPEPVYGLKVRYRDYQCDCCGHVHKVQTNHTGKCFPSCPKCSWRGARDSRGNLYNALQKQRPHFHVGDPVTEDEINPHARRATA